MVMKQRILSNNNYILNNKYNGKIFNGITYTFSVKIINNTGNSVYFLKTIVKLLKFSCKYLSVI